MRSIRITKKNYKFIMNMINRRGKHHLYLPYLKFINDNTIFRKPKKIIITRKNNKIGKLNIPIYKFNINRIKITAYDSFIEKSLYKNKFNLSDVFEPLFVIIESNVINNTINKHIVHDGDRIIIHRNYFSIISNDFDINITYKKYLKVNKKDIKFSNVFTLEA